MQLLYFILFAVYFANLQHLPIFRFLLPVSWPFIPITTQLLFRLSPFSPTHLSSLAFISLSQQAPSPSPPPTCFTSSHSHHAMRANSRPWHSGTKKWSCRVITEWCESGSDALNSRLLGEEKLRHWRANCPVKDARLPLPPLVRSPSVCPSSALSDVIVLHGLVSRTVIYVLYCVLKLSRSSRKKWISWL